MKTFLVEIIGKLDILVAIFSWRFQSQGFNTAMRQKDVTDWNIREDKEAVTRCCFCLSPEVTCTGF